jgi:hypothetical protein
LRKNLKKIEAGRKSSIKQKYIKTIPATYFSKLLQKAGEGCVMASSEKRTILRLLSKTLKNE